jgi:programmed cell death protein 4
MTKPVHAGVHGAVKKVVEKRGGHGAWGKPGEGDANSPTVYGERDPNFDEYEKNTVLTESTGVNGSGRKPEAIIHDILIEFAESGDISEAVEDLKEHASIEPAEFVAHAIEFGLEHHNYERELISQLLSELHPVFEGKGYNEGFQTILYRLPDLALDVPDAAEFVGLFFARAIYDEALAPAFIKNAVVDNELSKLAVNLAYNVVHEPSERARLENIWGPSALSSVEKLREEVGVIVKEFLVSLDIGEADRALLALNAPSFMSQVVKEAIFIGLERGNHVPRARVLDLLASWRTSGIISEYHMKRGFDLATRGLEEIKLDVPRAEEALSAFVTEAHARKIV